MSSFVSLYRYNGWANEQVMAVAGQLTSEQLNGPVEGMYGSILDTAAHLFGVEENFRLLMTGKDAKYPDKPDAGTIRQRLAANNAEFERFVANLTNDDLARKFRVPWFKRDFTVEDGLLQTIVHSTEHRADLCGAMTRAGLKTPPIDYIAWAIESGRSSPA
jgi:uncharacterized damage-inducible protein DinB